MKQSILILSSLLCICGISGAFASDAAQEPVTEPTTDNVQLSDSKYGTSVMDTLADTRALVNDLLTPKETRQNLWTDDAVITNDTDVQAVILKPMGAQQEGVTYGKKLLQHSELSLGNQNYYGETVYIINNFLSGADNISETDEEYNGEFGTAAKSAGKTGEDAKCPFKSPKKCQIWLRKPIVSETVSPRSSTLRKSVMDKVSSAIQENPNISANDSAMEPLLNRYRVLMRASQSCCTGGLTHQMRKSGASNELIYNFLADDATYEGFSSRCFVMDNEQIESASYSETANMVADVRDGCICKSKATLTALLAPFEQLYQEYPDFAAAPFEYVHTDGLGRDVRDSVNMDVQNVLNQLDTCP